LLINFATTCCGNGYVDRVGLTVGAAKRNAGPNWARLCTERISTDERNA